MQTRQIAFRKITVAPGASPTGVLLAPYALSVTLGTDIELRIGRFSCGLLALLSVSGLSGRGAAFECGAFCEAAPDVQIVIGGEHANERLWNLTLGGAAQVFRDMAVAGQGPVGVTPAAPVVIGDAVVLSTGAIVLAGAVIGSGAVIGAGAVVTGACEPCALHAGVPARKLRDRFGEELKTLHGSLRLAEVSAADVPRLPSLVGALEAGGLSLADYLATVSFLPSEPRLSFTAGRSGAGRVENLRLIGADVGGKPVPEEALARIRAYIGQPGPEIDWTPDIFEALGLY